MPLESTRLILRPWRPEDLNPFARLSADPHVMRFYPRPWNAQESLDRMLVHDKAIRERGWGFWAAELKATGAFIGYIGLNVPAYPTPVDPCVEIGWRLARENWGQGLAPEGARVALDVAFKELGLPEVVAFTPELNRPSRRVMEKVGMLQDAASSFPDPRIPRDHPLNPLVVYRILRGG